MFTDGTAQVCNGVEAVSGLDSFVCFMAPADKKQMFHVIVWLFWSTAEAVTTGIGKSDPLETLWTLGANRSRSFLNGLQTCQKDRNTMPLMLVSHCGEYPCECKKIYSRQIRQVVANIWRMGLRMQFATNRNDRKMIARYS